jgi:hypothetical protein
VAGFSQFQLSTFRFSSVAGGADPGRGAERLSERIFWRGSGFDSMRSHRPTMTSALPGPPSPVFRISAFSFPHFEEGEYNGSRGAAELAEKIQSSSLRALRASA